MKIYSSITLTQERHQLHIARSIIYIYIWLVVLFINLNYIYIYGWLFYLLIFEYKVVRRI
jgi:hypothetical protein